MKLSILICAIPERYIMLSKLVENFGEQINLLGTNDIEIIVDDTPRGSISVGLKRQHLLARARGEWIVYFDDDDNPNDLYVKWIYDAISHHNDIDCIGIRGIMTTNGVNPKTWCHRLGFPIYGDGKKITKWGYDYVRPIIHFNPVKRELALMAGFMDMRFGEDMDYSKRLNRYLKKEFFIDEELFHYQFTTHIKHHEKYGIKK